MGGKGRGGEGRRGEKRGGKGKGRTPPLQILDPPLKLLTHIYASVSKYLVCGDAELLEREPSA